MGEEWERGGGVTGRHWTEVSRRVAATTAFISAVGPLKPEDPTRPPPLLMSILDEWMRFTATRLVWEQKRVRRVDLVLARLTPAATQTARLLAARLHQRRRGARLGRLCHDSRTVRNPVDARRVPPAALLSLSCSLPALRLRLDPGTPFRRLLRVPARPARFGAAALRHRSLARRVRGLHNLGAIANLILARLPRARPSPIPLRGSDLRRSVPLALLPCYALPFSGRRARRARAAAAPPRSRHAEPARAPAFAVHEHGVDAALAVVGPVLARCLHVVALGRRGAAAHTAGASARLLHMTPVALAPAVDSPPRALLGQILARRLTQSTRPLAVQPHPVAILGALSAGRPSSALRLGIHAHCTGHDCLCAALGPARGAVAEAA
eukprot:scaffold12592_cov120-Isochrysis_galbana.AAC.2